MTTVPTAYPEINHLLERVLAGAKSILGARFVGMYLDGSLASGDFDQDSDVDFVVVATEEVSEAYFLQLRAMHDWLSSLDTPWAIQLEGFYVSQALLRRYDPARGPCPNLERGQGERLKWVHLGQEWDIHRWMVRERGIVLAGPAPKMLVDPLTPDRLRQAVVGPEVRKWFEKILSDPGIVSARGYQSYIVLTLCRILYTLETGEVASKPAAAGWAQDTLDARWSPLIERAWEGRHHSSEAAKEEDVLETLAMVRAALERITQVGTQVNTDGYG